MANSLEIEDIAEKRRLVGIDDVELEQLVRGLAVGDCVNITLRAATHPSAGETLAVQITEINGHLYRGKLARRPASTVLADLCAGVPVVFSATHIHSVSRVRPLHAP